jgi:AcrR family transcriptional regulator
MVMDPKEFREHAIKEAKCGIILDAARKLFAQKGYWETRLEDIAAAAGFSKASLYNYYIDKEAIFLSISINENQEMMEKIKVVAEHSETFAAALKSILEIFFKMVHEDFGIMVNVANFQNMLTMHANMFKHKDLLEQFIKTVNQSIELLEGLIRRARHSGELVCDLEDKTIARFIGMLVRSAIFEWNISPNKTVVDSTIREILEFVKRGAGVVRA